MILEGEIKDAKMSSFSSDFQTRIKHSFPLHFHHELLMSLRSLKAKMTIASSVPKKMKTLFLIFSWSYSAFESRQRKHSNWQKEALGLDLSSCMTIF